MKWINKIFVSKQFEMGIMEWENGLVCLVLVEGLV